MGLARRLAEWLGGPAPSAAGPADDAAPAGGAPDVRAELTTSKQLEEVLIAMGTEVRSGVAVTPENAMAVAAVASAVGILAESVAQIPLIVYRRTDERGKERAPEHPLWPLLHDRPNGFQDAFQFRELLQTHLALYGDAYAFKNRASGALRELLPLHPTRVEPEQQDDFRLIYKVRLPSGERVEMLQRDVLHLRDRSYDGVSGAGRVKTNREAVGLAKRLEHYGANFFGNNARPSGVLSTDANLREEQIEQIRESWTKAHGGDRAMGTAVLDGGFKWSQLNMNSTDAQFLENRKFQIAEVSRIFRVPPHMLGDLERATFSNIEQQSLEFVKFTLMPWLRRWEAAINTQLIGPEQSRTFFAEFLVEGLLRGTIKERFEAYQVAVQNGWMTRNEVREKENLNPIAGGDVITPAENVFGPGDPATAAPADAAA